MGKTPLTVYVRQESYSDRKLAEQRISDIEDGDTAKEALIQALENQEALQAKLTEFEARSRQNNLRIYGVPEESEGSNVSEFVTKLIKSEVGPPVVEIDLGIQRLDLW